MSKVIAGLLVAAVGTVALVVSALPSDAGSRSSFSSRSSSFTSRSTSSFRTSVPSIPRKPTISAPTTTSRTTVINRNYYHSSGPSYSSGGGDSFMPSFLGSYLGTSLAQPHAPAQAAPVIINGVPSNTTPPAQPPAPQVVYQDDQDEGGSSWLVWLFLLALIGGATWYVRRRA